MNGKEESATEKSDNLSADTGNTVKEIPGELTWSDILNNLSNSSTDSVLSAQTSEVSYEEKVLKDSISTNSENDNSLDVTNAALQSEQIELDKSTPKRSQLESKMKSRSLKKSVNTKRKKNSRKVGKIGIRKSRKLKTKKVTTTKKVIKRELKTGTLKGMLKFPGTKRVKSVKTKKHDISYIKK